MSWIGCTGGRTKITITPEGNVLICEYLRDPFFIVGNIRKDDLWNLWKNSYVLNFFRNLNKLEGKCTTCKYLGICKGGCRAMAYLTYGSIYAPDPLCWYRSDRGRVIYE
ncbi:MAG: hypothetical protein DRJ59_07335 [Thermoprotei archaeon]|nr:MAG: hypothetical protein DRJ59_07335 [Thermoprotei archaeon]